MRKASRFYKSEDAINKRLEEIQSAFKWIGEIKWFIRKLLERGMNLQPFPSDIGRDGFCGRIGSFIMGIYPNGIIRIILGGHYFGEVKKEEIEILIFTSKFCEMLLSKGTDHIDSPYIKIAKTITIKLNLLKDIKYDPLEKKLLFYFSKEGFSKEVIEKLEEKKPIIEDVIECRNVPFP